MTLDARLRDEMLAALPSLRAFAMSLCSNPDYADDLVQETLLRGLSKIHLFERGTNLEAWLFKILRNQFYSAYRKRRREVEDPEQTYAQKLGVPPEQEAWLDFQDFQAALAKLAPEQREALLLVGASGFSYEAAAEITDVAIGTIKSRVNRARRRLADLLLLDEEEALGPDRLTRAALQGSD